MSIKTAVRASIEILLYECNSSKQVSSHCLCQLFNYTYCPATLECNTPGVAKSPSISFLIFCQYSLNTLKAVQDGTSQGWAVEGTAQELPETHPHPCSMISNCRKLDRIPASFPVEVLLTPFSSSFKLVKEDLTKEDSTALWLVVNVSLLNLSQPGPLKFYSVYSGQASR